MRRAVPAGILRKISGGNYEGAVEVNLGGDAAVQKLVELCNPALSFPTEAHFIDFWGEVRETLTVFKGTHN